jgi:hypothetical protein
MEPWFADGLEVRLSIVHGQGLFVTEAFPFGSLIIRLGGCLFHISQRRSADVMPSTSTPLSEEVILAEPARGRKDYSDYLNHSCEPNIGFRDAISIVAIRNIAAGEELVIDYAFWECDAAWKLKTLCNCGSRNCRKIVSGEDWKQVRLTDDRLQYFSPFVRRRILALA